MFDTSSFKGIKKKWVILSSCLVTRSSNLLLFNYYSRTNVPSRTWRVKTNALPLTVNATSPRSSVTNKNHMLASARWGCLGFAAQAHLFGLGLSYPPWLFFFFSFCFLAAVTSEEGSRHKTTAGVSLRATRVHAEALNNNISGDKQTRPKQDKSHSCDRQDISVRIGLNLDAQTKWNVEKIHESCWKDKSEAAKTQLLPILQSKLNEMVRLFIFCILWHIFFFCQEDKTAGE